MDLEIVRMNEEIIELREDNQRLHKMCSIVEQMNDILSEAINQCKCLSDQTLDIKTHLNVLKDKYQQLKDTEIHFSSMSGKSQDVNSVSTQTTHSVIKRLTIKENTDECEDMDQMLTSNIVNVISLNDKQNNLLTIEAIDDSFYRDTEDVNLGFILPNDTIESQLQEFIESKQKTIEDKNKIRIISNKRVNKTKNKFKNTKKKTKLKERAKRVDCDWPGCQMKFRDSYNKSVHMLRHTGQKSFVCCTPGCHKSYATKAALDIHENSHLDNRRFKCPYLECTAAFIRKTQLNVHISQRHTRDFPYKCNWPGCEYQGCYLNRLNSHRLSHTGVKPYKCEWNGCDASFRLNHHLKAHMLKHTGEKPIPCELSSCDKRFQSKQAMKIHFERTHVNH